MLMPENILKRMSPSDREALGKAGNWQRMPASRRSGALSAKSKNSLADG